ncbi:MAG: hypothetical protein AUJ92_02425 [Armatimonadetes bacterium CG2_30_59_28]|nr:MAG: hypothetical protein AUJ92_02425 [Armatimonadetes bacterium CG2_30_59_28]PIU63342.1 MAG: hypothetical protein COS85_16310 [Armatimonadetes bacterium CG07_land_8_20_14_0_80_59_28]PIX39011.1 MAG: hypothetical protein COZ56_18880 [Armatimonadetes bacterium CG_4_8_14_3_um_filter_58_9]PIY41063.1 MAG: hypothetical protein COZ05_16340 [Armatimonadetes bacterium CG_4_10_14_3_um_filter_59_10]
MTIYLCGERCRGGSKTPCRQRGVDDRSRRLTWYPFNDLGDRHRHRDSAAAGDDGGLISSTPIAVFVLSKMYGWFEERRDEAEVWQRNGMAGRMPAAIAVIQPLTLD